MNLTCTTVYGLMFGEILFYIGCTDDLERRKQQLFGQFKALKAHKSKIEVRVLAECSNKRFGKEEETRLITEQILGGNKMIANATPSVTLTNKPHNIREAWRSHQLAYGSFPNVQLGKRGFGNWSEMAFSRILNILNGGSK